MTYIYTPNTSLVVTVDEAKKFASIYRPDQDAMIESFIVSAQTLFEAYTQQTLLTTNFTLYLESLPKCTKIIKTPFASLTSIEYLDDNDVWTAIDTSYYTLIIGNPYYSVYLTSSFISPSDISITNPQKWRINFVAGRATADDVPESIKQTIKNIVTDAYEHRTVEEEFALFNVDQVHMLMNVHRIPGIR